MRRREIPFEKSQVFLSLLLSIKTFLTNLVLLAHTMVSIDKVILNHKISIEQIDLESFGIEGKKNNYLANLFSSHTSMSTYAKTNCNVSCAIGSMK